MAPQRRILSIFVHWLVLWAFWILLSGKYDEWLYVTIGGLSALGVAFWTRHLMMIDDRDTKVHAIAMPWWRLIAYVPWLLWQITLSAIHVMFVVFRPQRMMDPALIRMRVELPGELAHLTLANSITLTPGTITVDRSGTEFLIHALTVPAADGLLAGDMQERVARVFYSRVEREDQLSSKAES